MSGVPLIVWPSSGNDHGGVSVVPLIVWPSSGNDHAGVSVDPDSMGMVVLWSGSDHGSVGVVPVSGGVDPLS